MRRCFKLRYVTKLNRAQILSESILSGSHDTTIRGWDIKMGACFIEWKAHDSGVSCLKATGNTVYRCVAPRAFFFDGLVDRTTRP